MAILSRIGKRIPLSRFKTMEGLATATVGVSAIAGVAGFASQHPMKPSVDAYEDIFLGSPDALTQYAGAAVSTTFNNAWAGPNAQNRIDELRTPIRRPMDFSPPGALVMGMYNSRHG